MAVQFAWSTERDHRAPRGERYVLRSDAFPAGHFSPQVEDDRLAVCSYWGGRRWRATFYLGYDAIDAWAGTHKAALRLLQARLTERASELFGEPELEFSAPC